MRKRSAVVAPEIPPESSQETVRKTSEALKEELEKNAPKTRIEEAFEHRNRGSDKEQPSLIDNEIAGIVEVIFVEHPLEEYKKLEAALRIGDKHNDHGTVAKALDNAESYARLAHRLWMTARVERDRWEKDNALIFAGMRDGATRALQREKEQGIRNKMITDADVEAMCAVMFADEWRDQEIKRRRVEAMVKSMENLNECWTSRCRTLQAMLTKMR